MFADHTLTPREAVRLCALGLVARGPCRYSALASEMRHFIGRIMGPSLELLGSSIELLLYEGLIEAREGSGMEDDALLALTGDGRDEFERLMTARMRASSDLSKLIVALKFRFLHLLESEDQALQADLLHETYEAERTRLTDLRAHHAEDEGHLVAWLDHDIALVEARLGWLDTFRARLGGEEAGRG